MERPPGAIHEFPKAPHLIVTAEEWPPHIYVRPGPSGSASISGPMAQLLESLAESINFTYTVIQGDGYWGAPQENGEWNGMIGTVLRQEAEVGLGPFGMTNLRADVVDFTTPVFLEKSRILVRRPRPEPNPWGFLSPLTWFVWVGLFGSALLIVVTSLVIGSVLNMDQRSSFLDYFWAVFSIFFSQSLTWTPRGNSLRIVFWLWIIITLIVMRSYSGALTSLLAVKTVAIKHDSLQDVIEDTGLKLIFEGSTALTAYMERAESGTYRELYESSRGRSLFFQASKMAEAAYRFIPGGSHAMLLEDVGCKKIYSDHYSRTGRCEFYMSSTTFWPIIYAMIVQKGSPLRRLIDARILALNEFGIYERWANARMPNMTACIKTPTKLTIHESYALKDLWAVFLLLGCGLLLALLLFAFEVFLKKVFPKNV
ncbi:putative glutamate receptor [Oratosquilla oratoria]|uniref:putative glutamate receptor n=1 Tax=Oratosquilla oratoria TaxID=337810 RepID=UPI003F7747A4